MKHVQLNHIRFFFQMILAVIIFCCGNPPEMKAQEKGKLLMKQELGYTLGGGVAGAGLGVLLWFMDPLNPDVTLRNQVKDGFIVGTSFGALFGFYMLNNAILFPDDQINVQDFDELLGLNEQDERRMKYLNRNRKPGTEWTMPIIQFRF